MKGKRGGKQLLLCLFGAIMCVLLLFCKDRSWDAETPVALNLGAKSRGRVCQNAYICESNPSREVSGINQKRREYGKVEIDFGVVFGGNRLSGSGVRL